VIRRRALVAGALGVLAAPFAAEAQPAARTARIGLLELDVAAEEPPSREAFFRTLRDLGWVEGRNLVIEYRDAAGRTERFPTLAAELVALKVDVIVTAGGTLAAKAAKQATMGIPIVFASVGDPVAEGLVTSLGRPGGNLTGSSAVFSELVAKWLEVLRQAVPGVRRVALLLKPDALPDPAKTERLKAADVAARALGMRLQVVEARGPEDFDRAFSDMIQARAEALVVWATPVFNLGRGRLVQLAAMNRLPAVYSYRTYVDVGGLMSYGPDRPEMFRRAATYVDKILKGARPANLPIEQPTKFELVINLKTAKTLGLTVPPSVLARADEVIQ
jgi:putative tryptophan/tyrosine transport system substrate-binding protein